jgi:ATP-binding cassette subfamily B protein
MHGGGGGMWMASMAGFGWGDRPKPKQPFTRARLLRILRYFRPHLSLVAATVGFIVVSSLVGLVPPLLIARLIDHALPHHDFKELSLIALLMMASGVVGGVIGVGQSYFNTLVGQRVMLDIRNQLYSHLLRLSLRFFTVTKTGEIMSRVSNDVSNVQGTITNSFVVMLTNLVMVASTLVLMFVWNWRLTLLSLAIIPVFLWPTRNVGRINYAIQQQVQKKLADLTAHMQETLNVSGVVLVKSFVRQRHEAAKFRRSSEELTEMQIRASMLGRWFFMVLGLFGVIGPALIFWYGGLEVFRGALTVGQVVAFVALLGRLYMPLSSLLGLKVELQSSMALFERIFEYLDLPVEIEDKPNAPALPPVRGHIAFEQVGFEYLPGRPVLHAVSFEVQPGQLAALVGPSGAGKTTLTYLVPRFYDPTSGSVRIDGHDIRDVQLASLGRQIGIVTQETYLFHASLRDNLRYGNEGAPEEDVIAAARAAHIHEMIAALPEGYETIVGERGYRLSGGEKQRVAIARAILTDPRILILDEATSSLDSQSEAFIQEALERLRRGRTSLVIAHRLSTILQADVILVIDQGRLVEKGTHAELLARSGLYARLYEQQFKPRRRLVEEVPA